MFELKEKEKLVVIVTTSGEEVGVYYREPTTKEMHQYHAEAIQRKRNKVTFRYSEAQYKFGLIIMTGIREGDFGAPGDDGKVVAISSDPNKPNYRKDWLELMQRHAGAVIIALGAHVFGGTEALDGDEEKPVGDADGESGENIDQD